MDISFYQNLKLTIISIVDLSKDAIHIHIGLVVFFLVVVLWKKGRFEVVCIVPVLVIACLMELLDLRDDLSSLGYLRWSASVHDVINTTLWPIVITILVKVKIIGSNL
ncbi:MAG: hypothetical protein OEX19_14250 [Gammaproteobacteria bacterium]|nr:hypothetical protein [Gammaproteobacteria bacterium]